MQSFHSSASTERACPLPLPPAYLHSCLTKLGMEHPQPCPIDMREIYPGNSGAGWRRGNKRLCNNVGRGGFAGTAPGGGCAVFEPGVML